MVPGAAARSTLDHYGAELHVSEIFLKHFKSDKFKSRVFDHGHNLKNLDLFISLGGWHPAGIGNLRGQKMKPHSWCKHRTTGIFGDHGP